MSLSDELQRYHDCGDYGQALEGFAERAKVLEDALEKAYDDRMPDILQAFCFGGTLFLIVSYWLGRI